MKRGFFYKLRALIIWAILIFLLGCTTLSERPKQSGEIEPPSRAMPEQVRHSEEMLTRGAIAEVAHRIIPSVVGISTTEITRESLWSEPVTLQGVGSGVVVDPNGYILTNDHVAGGSPSSIRVIFKNGDELEGRTLWSDPTLDLAIVKVDAEGLVAAPLGSCESLLVGDAAIAVGTPLGLQFQHTVTSGIISALNRTVKVPTSRGENFMEDLIQTDASINPGNSGGPLVNIKGEVIGINTIKVTSAESIGFAIPIDVAKPIIGHFLNEGEFTTPYIGIVGFDREMASYHDRNNYIQEGIYVVEMDSRGPAYRAGIRVDDIIVMVGGEKVNKMLDLRKAIYSYRVGQSIKISLLRGGREMVITMTLAEKPV